MMAGAEAAISAHETEAVWYREERKEVEGAGVPDVTEGPSQP